MLEAEFRTSKKKGFGPEYRPAHGWSEDGYPKGALLARGYNAVDAIVGPLQKTYDSMREKFGSHIKLFYFKLDNFCILWTEFKSSLSAHIPEHVEWQQYVHRILVECSKIPSGGRMEDMDDYWRSWTQRKNTILPHLEHMKTESGRMASRKRGRSQSPPFSPRRNGRDDCYDGDGHRRGRDRGREGDREGRRENRDRGRDYRGFIAESISPYAQESLISLQVPHDCLILETIPHSAICI